MSRSINVTKGVLIAVVSSSMAAITSLTVATTSNEKVIFVLGMLGILAAIIAITGAVIFFLAEKKHQ